MRIFGTLSFEILTFYITKLINLVCQNLLKFGTFLRSYQTSMKKLFNKSLKYNFCAEIKKLANFVCIQNLYLENC